ncbi:hypothetical protein GWK47_028447 [Chionoecetes opilio]|uniref:Uncharacterized protein n=1 Tax=Chionoecetes opilio TaxID=41210 RepID=A0A8J4YP42_CHIOP|nr:hypothetical protein GWK47_028447 [Chionoecetes opilio]
MKQNIEEYELQNNSLTSELGTWKAKCIQLEKKCSSLQDQLQGSVPQQDHQMAVKECQRLFEDLRKAYKQESGNMKGKIHAVRSEKQNLAEKLTDTSAYLHGLRGQVSGLKGSLRLGDVATPPVVMLWETRRLPAPHSTTTPRPDQSSRRQDVNKTCRRLPTCLACPELVPADRRKVSETIEHFLLQCLHFHSRHVVLRSQLLTLNVATFDLPALLAAAGVHPSRQHAVIRLTCAFLRKTGQLQCL